VVEERRDTRVKVIPLHWLILLDRVPMRADPFFDNGT
jgi:hypothetical protein